MKKITNITSNAKQTFDLILDDNSIATFSLEYLDSQQGWVYGIEKGTFIVSQRKLVISFNILKQFKNYINFGIFVTSVDKLDPAFIEDFENDRISIYVLNESEVDTVEEEIYV